MSFLTICHAWNCLQFCIAIKTAATAGQGLKQDISPAPLENACPRARGSVCDARSKSACFASFETAACDDKSRLADQWIHPARGLFSWRPMHVIMKISLFIYKGCWQECASDSKLSAYLRITAAQHKLSCGLSWWRADFSPYVTEAASRWRLSKNETSCKWNRNFIWCEQFRTSSLCTSIWTPCINAYIAFWRYEGSF